jgi:lipoprotein-anchoring transpeptidase ErfK/SrfK
MAARRNSWGWRGLVLALLGTAVLGGGPGDEAAAKGRAVRADLGYPPGTIVIVNNERRLYFIAGEGRAIRYPVAVGTRRELWVGRTFVSNMRKNPPWTPVDGGGATVRGGIPSNPLGKRALYLDWSLLRIHGTPSRGSIGRAASNGCIRMLNEDVIELYERVHIGAPVIAINSRREADRFAAKRVTGKQPAYAKRASAR